MRIGLIGLGKLGRAVGERLLDEQFELACWNRSRQADEGLGRLSSRRVATLEPMIADSQAIIILVRDDAAVQEVCERLSATPLAGKLVLQMSTIRPQTAIAAAARIGAAGGRFVDVPVSGTIGPAREGKLLLLAGGATEHLSDAGGIFAALGRRTFHLGPVGSGSMMKLVLNLILSIYNEALAEALAFGQAGGLNVRAMLDVLVESPAALPMVANKRALFEGTDTGVTVDMKRVLGELITIEQTARELGLPTPAASAASSMIAAAVAGGYGDRDIAALTRFWLEKIAPQGPSQ